MGVEGATNLYASTVIREEGVKSGSKLIHFELEIMFMVSLSFGLVKTSSYNRKEPCALT